MPWIISCGHVFDRVAVTKRPTTAERTLEYSLGGKGLQVKGLIQHIAIAGQHMYKIGTHTNTQARLFEKNKNNNNSDSSSSSRSRSIERSAFVGLSAARSILSETQWITARCGAAESGKNGPRILPGVCCRWYHRWYSPNIHPLAPVTNFFSKNVAITAAKL